MVSRIRLIDYYFLPERDGSPVNYWSKRKKKKKKRYDDDDEEEEEFRCSRMKGLKERG